MLMCDFSLCIGCPYDDPDFGCLRSPGDDCRLTGDVTHSEDQKPAPWAQDVLHMEVSS